MALSKERGRSVFIGFCLGEVKTSKTVVWLECEVLLTRMEGGFGDA